MNKSIMSAILGPIALAILNKKSGAKNNPLDEIIQSITKNKDGLVVSVTVKYVASVDMSWCDPDDDFFGDCEGAAEDGWFRTEVAELPGNLESALDFYRILTKEARRLGEDADQNQNDFDDFALTLSCDFGFYAVARRLSFFLFEFTDMVIPDSIDISMVPRENNDSFELENTNDRGVREFTFNMIFKTDDALMDATGSDIYDSIVQIINIAFYMTGELLDSDELQHILGEIMSVETNFSPDIKLPLSANLNTEVRRF